MNAIRVKSDESGWEKTMIAYGLFRIFILFHEMSEFWPLISLIQQTRNIGARLIPSVHSVIKKYAKKFT